MKASEILQQGKRNIERFGWAQGDYIVSDDDPRNRGVKVCGVCTLGAVRLAALGIDEVHPETDVRLDVLLDSVSPETYHAYERATDLLEVASERHDVPDWNDRPGRTVEEINAVFDLAIQQALRVEGEADGGQ